MAVHACTIIARNYQAAARVLATSFFEHNPDGTFSTLIIDDRDALLDDSSEPFEILRLSDIGFARDEQHRFAAIYDIMEFATGVKPWLLEHLIARYSGPVLYIDPDIKIYQSLSDLAELASRHDLVLTPHATSPMPRDELLVDESLILVSGIYNLGFIATGTSSTPFLSFWKERLYRECLSDPDHARFVDQRWVDFAPGMYDAFIVRDPTYNVAYWNLDHRRLTWHDGQYLVNGMPLRFFHFSGYDPRVPELLSKYQGGRARILLSERPVVARICAEYRDALFANGYEDHMKINYAFARLDNGLHYDPLMRHVYREALLDAERSHTDLPPNPFDAAEDFIDWLTSAEPGRRLSRYVAGAYELDRLIQKRFPDPDGADYEMMRVWSRDEASQGRLNPRLIPDQSALTVSSNSDPLPAVDGDGALTPGVRVAGYLRAEMGVGQLGRLAVEAVRAAGIIVSTHVDTVTVARQRHSFTPEVRDDLNVNLICVNADELPHFSWRVGPEFFTDRYTVGLWAWELEEFPERFDNAFDHVDEVWALSEFARKAIATRAKKPVFAFPLPVVAPVTTNKLDRSRLHLPDSYMFLFCFDLMSIFERKNPLGLIQAFSNAFQPEEGPVLVIKALNGEHRLAELERLRLATASRPDIVILDEYLDPDENAALFASADCYVSLHRSEGFGLTMAEAMALGKPVISTAYSGNLDFMREDNAYLVPYAEGVVPSGCDPYPAGARWAEPDLDVAATLIRHVYEHPEEAATVGARARAHIAEHHAPANRAQFLRERFAAAQTALAERAEARRSYFAPLSAASDAVEAAPASGEGGNSNAPPPLIALAQRGPAENSPSRHPRLARIFRRSIGRALRHHDEYQQEMNLALALGTEHVARIIGELQPTLQRQTEWLDTLKWRVDHLATAVSAMEDARAEELRSLGELRVRATTRDQGLADATRRVAELAAQLGRFRRVLADERRELQSIPYMSDPATFVDKDDQGRPALGYRLGDAQSAGYVAFEDLFRGPEELIRERQRVYLPILESSAPVVDIGCGRGEMLDLLQEGGIAARGVDLDPTMVERSLKKGHDVVTEDALTYLLEQPDGSIGGIFSAQFVEHLPYEELVKLLHEARRVLRTDGLLIMETVNPYPIASFRTFWTDLTHQAPIFPEVLLALTREAGFTEARVLFPNGTGALDTDRWNAGEYAVVARKGNPA